MSSKILIHLCAAFTVQATVAARRVIEMAGLER